MPQTAFHLLAVAIALTLTCCPTHDVVLSKKGYEGRREGGMGGGVGEQKLMNKLFVEIV